MEFLFTAISLPVMILIQAALLMVAVKVFDEQIDLRSSLLVMLGMSGTVLVVDLLGIRLLGVILLKKLSTVDSIWPKGILIAVLLGILSSMVRFGLAYLFR